MLAQQLHNDLLFHFWRDHSASYQVRDSKRLELEEEDPPVVKVTYTLEISYFPSSNLFIYFFDVTSSHEVVWKINHEVVRVPLL